jgi:prepilin-type N-terminal cleavage/methylation domain-containing protein/prepilin-type processing-associated H-X9-DG protein
MSAEKNKQGFTLIELLVVIAIIALLLSIVMPALKIAKKKASSVVCLTNSKNLSLGWYNYAQDNDERIMSATMENCGPVQECREGWIGIPFKEDGTLCDAIAVSPYVVTDEDEIRGLRQGKLFAYLNDSEVYHCPGDTVRKAAPDMSNMYVSYSIAKCLYGATNSGTSWYNRQIKKYAEIRSPSLRYNFVECGEMNLNWGGGGDFRIANPAEGHDDYKWWTPIAINHGDSSTFGFCDGHAEYKKWTSGTALAQFEKGRSQTPGASYGVAAENPKSEDLQWVITGWPYH